MRDGILAYIGIGSNMDDPRQNCRESIARLSRVAGVSPESVSSFYRTEPVPVAGRETPAEASGEQSWFVNAVMEIRTTLLPRDLLSAMQDIEQAMGRARTYPGAPRVIDLDLLLYGQDIIREEDLTVPHPEMHKRLFVLEPICEIASYVLHPVFGVSMRGLKDRLDDSRKVERL